MTTPDPLDQLQVIRLDDLPWLELQDPTGYFTPQAWLKPAIGAACDISCLLIKLAPGESFEPHWHNSDVLYLVQRGEITVEGEGTYRFGDVRWAKAGVLYNEEVAGPEGAEFFVINGGPPGSGNPTQGEPPNGTVADVVAGRTAS